MFLTRILIVVAFCSAKVLHAGTVNEYLNLKGIEFKYIASTGGTSAYFQTSLSTKHEIVNVETSFFTIYDHPAQWHFFQYVTGFVDVDARALIYGSTVTRYSGEVDLSKELLMFTDESGTNLVRSTLSITPSTLDAQSFVYKEYVEEDEVQKMFLATTHVQGRFPDDSYGRVFVVPEPAFLSYGIVGAVLLFRRRRI